MQGIKIIENGGRIAEFSQDMRYRYCLTIEIDRSLRTELSGLLRRCVFIMLNPSTADHEKNDPTVSRCLKFAQALGFETLVVVNLFAFRATEPAEMKRHLYPTGSHNADVVRREVMSAGRVIAAWGNHGKYLNAGPNMLDLLKFLPRASGCIIPYDVQIERIDR